MTAPCTCHTVIDEEGRTAPATEPDCVVHGSPWDAPADVVAEWERLAEHGSEPF